MSLPSFNFFSIYSYIIIAAGLFAAALFFIWQKKRTVTVGFNKNTPTLSQYSKDLTQLAGLGKLDPVIGREDEIKRVIQTLCRRTKNNPVLIGKPGVGKTAIAEGLAQMIAQKKVPKILLGKRVLALDLTSIVAGTKYRGEFEKRLKQIADEITASERKIILFIDEVHTLGEAGGAEGSIGAGDILKPALARGDLQVIGATTAAEYKTFIKKDVTLDRRLHPILVDEPTPKETVMILKGIKRKYEQFHKVKITDQAIIEAVNLAVEHIKDKSFPDKAIDLMDEAASKISIENLNGKPESQWPKVQPDDVREVIKDWLENRVV